MQLKLTKPRRKHHKLHRRRIAKRKSGRRLDRGSALRWNVSLCKWLLKPLNRPEDLAFQGDIYTITPVDAFSPLVVSANLPVIVQKVLARWDWIGQPNIGNEIQGVHFGGRVWGKASVHPVSIQFWCLPIVHYHPAAVEGDIETPPVLCSFHFLRISEQIYSLIRIAGRRIL